MFIPAVAIHMWGHTQYLNTTFKALGMFIIVMGCNLGLVCLTK